MVSCGGLNLCVGCLRAGSAAVRDVLCHRRAVVDVDRVVALVGPLAIIAISIVVGGLIVSVMTSLLSVSQLVG